MRAPFLPSPGTKMISLCGMHSWSFLAVSIHVVFIIFSVNTHICSNLESQWWSTPYSNLTAKYTNDSKFVSNVNTALNSLHVDVEQTSQGRFNTCVYGQIPDQIYALL